MLDNLFLAERYPFLNKVVLQGRIAWSIRLRWAAVFLFFLTFLLAKYAFELNLSFQPLFQIIISLAVFNLLCYIIFKWVKEFSLLFEIIFLTVQIVFDLIILTVLLSLTGGIDNPLYLFYLFHVIMGSIILPRNFPYLVSTLVILLFGSLIYLEQLGQILYPAPFKFNTVKSELYFILVMIIFSFTVYICTYITKTFMDIFRKSKRELEGLNKKLLETDKIKSDFFKFTSHELKSPIVAIKSAIDGVIKIEAKKLGASSINILRRASMRADQMLNIINELLELLNKKKATEDKSLTKIEIHDALKKLLENEREHLENKKIKIISVFRNSELFLKFCPEDFNTIFANLISNAINYTPEGGTIKIITEKLANEIKIKINDSGIGIPEKDYESIFSEFYRAENAKKKVTYGTGLGLSIVKQIVDNNQGQIEVKSKVGEGSTFEITLPLRK